MAAAGESPALTGDVTASGTGSVAATVVGINGTTLSGLATGPLCNTTTTGVPSDCTLSAFTTLGLAPLASPAFTGTPTAPTAAVGTNTTQVATTAFVQAARAPVGSVVGGDTICALHADTSIRPQAITAGTSISGVSSTVTVAAVTSDFYAGGYIEVNGTTPAEYVAAYAPITAVTGTTITYTNASATGAAWVSGGHISIGCSNQSTDGTTATNFATTFAVPANSFGVGNILKVLANASLYTPATTGTGSFEPQWSYGATKVWGAGGFTANSAGTTNVAFGNELNLVSLSSTLFTASSPTYTINGHAQTATQNVVNYPLAVTTTSNQNILFGVTMQATAVASGTYTSGITATGTATQTCTLTTFNNGSTATATVALTGTNTIAGGTALVITAAGDSATAAPTSATAGSGTATCSGTAVIATVLQAAPGYAVTLRALVPELMP